jgi:hypothetical protein
MCGREMKGAGEKGLWRILVRGVVQPLKASASSEDEAIGMWLGQTNRRGPRSEIKAEPEPPLSESGNGVLGSGAASGRYHCSVVVLGHTRRGVLEWYTDDRKEAVAEVKRMVRTYGTEGGVESQDARHPFDVAFAMVKGRLERGRYVDTAG